MTRPTARQRGYDTQWERARAEHLLLHPTCAMCAEEGLIVRATTVDHIEPHRGDQRLFWSPNNWQSLCTSHHSSAKQQAEKRGYSTRVGRDGLPVDRQHPFHRDAPGEPVTTLAQHPRQLCAGASCNKAGASQSPELKGAGPPGFSSSELVVVPRVPRWA